jgi:nucleosome assembly protein 1-like 1
MLFVPSSLPLQYLALYTPLFDRRLEITLGHSAPTKEEIAAGEAQSLKDDPTHTPLPTVSTDFSPNVTSANPGAGIPEFWLTALRNHVGISDLITERDAEALKHLTDIRVTYLPEAGNETGADPSALGFKLTFHFTENDFFNDTVLTKTYVYRDELGYEGDFVYDHALGSEIQWKEDKDLTKSFEIKKQRNKSEP